ncbi:MAG: DoxX family protein [Patescibacteria group bacterium]
MAHKITLFLLRISLGWLMFYAGITKVLDPAWSAEGYLKGAKLFPGFFEWLLSPGILPTVNLLNEWGLTLLGISLILGIFVRYSAPLGALLMILYYLPLGMPYPDPHSYIVDDHIIYALSLAYLGAARAGRTWGLDGWRK